MGTVCHERFISGSNPHVAGKRSVRAMKDDLCDKPVNRAFQRQVQESCVAAPVREPETAFFIRLGDEHGIAAEMILCRYAGFLSRKDRLPVIRHARIAFGGIRHICNR